MGRVDAPEPDPAEVAASLRAVIAAIDRRELVADEVQRAYLTGAAQALETLGGPETATTAVFEHPHERDTTV